MPAAMLNLRAWPNLPPLVQLIRQYQLDVPMVTTDIVDTDTRMRMPF